MIKAGRYSKTQNFWIDEQTGQYNVQFVVKWFYRYRCQRFNAAVSRWVKDMKREGFKVRAF